MKRLTIFTLFFIGAFCSKGLFAQVNIDSLLNSSTLDSIVFQTGSLQKVCTTTYYHPFGGTQYEYGNPIGNFNFSVRVISFEKRENAWLTYTDGKTYIGTWYPSFLLDSTSQLTSFRCERVLGDANNNDKIQIWSSLPPTIREVSGTYQLESEKIIIFESHKNMSSGQGYTLTSCSCDFSTLTADSNRVTLHLSSPPSKVDSSISQSHRIWPNPASTFININDVALDRSNIQLIDIFGRSIPIQAIQVDYGVQLDVRSLNQGCYFLKVNNEINKVIIE